jgi:glucokinase
MNNLKLKKEVVILAGDIGGTNCRFQLGRIDIRTLGIKIIKTSSWKCSTYKNMNQALEEFLSSSG